MTSTQFGHLSLLHPDFLVNKSYRLLFWKPFGYVPQLFCFNFIGMMEVENTNMAKLMELIDSIKEIRFVIQSYFKKQLKKNDLGITVEMLEVLMVLSSHNQINQQQIADRVRKNKANLTPIIDKLSLKNLVQRREDSTDRRNKLISLTEKGQKVCSKYHALFEEFYASFLKSIDSSNLDKTIHILKNIGRQVAKSS